MAVNSITSNTAAATAASQFMRPQPPAAKLQGGSDPASASQGVRAAEEMQQSRNAEAAKPSQAMQSARPLQATEAVQTTQTLQAVKQAESSTAVRQAESLPPKPIVNELGQKTGTIINTTA